jgi:hypothetical protein
MAPAERKYPSIPDPRFGGPDAAVQAIKETVEVLTRQRGKTLHSAVTFQDLVDLGLITEAEVP